MKPSESMPKFLGRPQRAPATELPHQTPELVVSLGVQTSIIAKSSGSKMEFHKDYCCVCYLHRI